MLSRDLLKLDTLSHDLIEIQVYVAFTSDTTNASDGHWHRGSIQRVPTSVIVVKIP